MGLESTYLFLIFSFSGIWGFAHLVSILGHSGPENMHLVAS